jgi:hypothetical protein
MERQKFCRNCGSALEKDWQFCENCGAPLPSAPATPSVSQPYPSVQQTPAPQQVPQGAPPPVNTGKKRSPIWVILGVVIGCLAIACIVVSVVGGIYYLRNRSNSLPEINYIVSETPAPLPTETPLVIDTPTSEPVVTDIPTSTPTTQPTEQETQSMGSESLPQPDLITTHLSFSRWPLDYSLGWEIGETDVYITDINQDQSWIIGIKKPQSIVLVVPPHPLTFTNGNMLANVKVKAGDFSSAGPYGLICNLQDENNYYFVEVWGNQFAVGKLEDNFFTPLTDPYWQESQFIGDIEPDGFVNLGISCSDYSIGVIINGFGETFPVYDPGESFSSGAVAVFGASSQEAVDMLMGIFYFKDLVIEEIQ